METCIFDIARGSINDGPGIRTTVFVKGCPLSCIWCHNPESQVFSPQLSYHDNLCIDCGQCFSVCKRNVHYLEDGQHKIAFSQCNHCGECVDICPTEALTIMGKNMSARQVFDIVKKDMPFYQDSNGGLTISGGEPLSHRDFCIELLSLCREAGIHTCIETSGMGKPETLKELAKLTDLFLYDWKVSSKALAERTIGTSNEIIQDNLEMLLSQNAKVILRCPIIPEINDTDEHFTAIASFLSQNKYLYAELLPYHSFGVGKGEGIGKKQEKFRNPTDDDKENWLQWFRKRDIQNIKI